MPPAKLLRVHSIPLSDTPEDVRLGGVREETEEPDHRTSLAVRVGCIIKELQKYQNILLSDKKKTDLQNSITCHCNAIQHSWGFC